MTAFAYELATVMAHQASARAGDPEGAYAMPWYLVVGEPGSGRSTAIKAMNLSWPRGDQPVALNMPEQLCSYWLPEKALFLEPGPTVLGPRRIQGRLAELCEELMVKRPREPMDGMILVVSAQQLVDGSEDAALELAKSLRRYLIEVQQALGAEIPVYVVVTAYDSLWGFGDAFQWTAARRDEEPWGFSLPPGLGAAETPARVKLELEGLLARIESMCFAKLSTEEPPEARTRALQHLVEARDLLTRLTEVMHVITMANAFERSPWVRALIIGSGIVGTGHRLRHCAVPFGQMGLYPPAHSGTPQPGGMPLHALLELVLLPERDIVPTRTRWRDDVLIVVLWILGLLAWIGAVVLIVMRMR